jgi:hypothetical protein
MAKSNPLAGPLFLGPLILRPIGNTAPPPGLKLKPWKFPNGKRVTPVHKGK